MVCDLATGRGRRRVTSNLALAAGYVVNKNVDLQLNLYSIFDKDYVAAINKSGYRYTPGSPRAVSLTVNFRF